MKYIFTFILFLSATVNYAQKVTVDFDNTYDFSKVKTYGWLGWQENSGDIVNDLDKKRLRSAFVSEFNAREMIYADKDGNVAISLYIVANQKTSTTAYTNHMGGAGYGYRRGGAGWGMDLLLLPIPRVTICRERWFWMCLI